MTLIPDVVYSRAPELEYTFLERTEVPIAYEPLPVPAGYLEVPGAGSATLADDNSLDITSDIEIVVRTLCYDSTPATNYRMVYKALNASTSASYDFFISGSGDVFFSWWDGAAVQQLTPGGSYTLNSVGINDGDAFWFKVTFDADNGASGRTAKFYYFIDRGLLQVDEPLFWTQLGPTATSATATTLTAGAQSLYLGNRPDGARALNGRLYRVIIRNGIGGPKVVDADFTNLATGVASFAEGTGKTVTVNSTASVVAATVPSPFANHPRLAWFDDSVVYAFRRCNIYNADGTLWRENVGIVDGSVSVDASRAERRTLDLALDNTDHAIDLDPELGLWYDKIIKVWRGVIVDGVAHGWKLGTYMIDTLTEESQSGVIKVTARDYTKKMMLSKFAATTAFAAGLDIAAIIKTLMTNSGITDTLCPPTGVLTGKEFVFDIGTSRWDAAKQIADEYGYELFFDPHGRGTLRTWTDPLTAPISITYDAASNENGYPDNVITWNRKATDARIVNHVIVYAAATQSSVGYSAELENDEPTSPTRIARIGRRTRTMANSLLTSNADCLATAQRFLAISALEQFDLSVDSAVYPWLDVATTIQHLSDASYAPSRYLLLSLTIPLGLASMAATAGRVTIVG